MDSISLVGITLGFAAILVGQVLEGGHIGSLVQPTAFLIVIGGTLGAVMLQMNLRLGHEALGYVVQHSAAPIKRLQQFTAALC